MKVNKDKKKTTKMYCECIKDNVTYSNYESTYIKQIQISGASKSVSHPRENSKGGVPGSVLGLILEKEQNVESSGVRHKAGAGELEHVIDDLHKTD